MATCEYQGQLLPPSLNRRCSAGLESRVQYYALQLQIQAPQLAAPRPRRPVPLQQAHSPASTSRGWAASRSDTLVPLPRATHEGDSWRLGHLPTDRMYYLERPPHRDHGVRSHDHQRLAARPKCRRRRTGATSYPGRQRGLLPPRWYARSAGGGSELRVCERGGGRGEGGQALWKSKAVVGGRQGALR